MVLVPYYVAVAMLQLAVAFHLLRDTRAVRGIEFFALTFAGNAVVTTGFALRAAGASPTFVDRLSTMGDIPTGLWLLAFALLLAFRRLPVLPVHLAVASLTLVAWLGFFFIPSWWTDPGLRAYVQEYATYAGYAAAVLVVVGSRSADRRGTLALLAVLPRAAEFVGLYGLHGFWDASVGTTASTFVQYTIGRLLDLLLLTSVVIGLLLPATSWYRGEEARSRSIAPWFLTGGLFLGLMQSYAILDTGANAETRAFLSTLTLLLVRPLVIVALLMTPPDRGRALAAGIGAVVLLASFQPFEAELDTPPGVGVLFAIGGMVLLMPFLSPWGRQRRIRRTRIAPRGPIPPHVTTPRRLLLSLLGLGPVQRRAPFVQTTAALAIRADCEPRLVGRNVKRVNATRGGYRSAPKTRANTESDLETEPLIGSTRCPLEGRDVRAHVVYWLTTEGTEVASSIADAEGIDVDALIAWNRTHPAGSAETDGDSPSVTGKGQESPA